MQRRQVRQEERFTRRLRNSVDAGMGFYNGHIVPHLVNLAMRNGERLGHFVGGDARHSSLAAAMGLPAAFPYRDFIVLTAFSAVLDTLVLHVLTLKLSCVLSITMTMGPAAGRRPCGREFLFVDSSVPEHAVGEGQLVKSVASKGQEKGNLWRHASLLDAFLPK